MASTNPDYNCDNAVGIYLEDCTNCLVDGNGNSPEPTLSTNEPVKAGGFGIYLKGDAAGTKLACNELDSNDYHIYLADVNQWSDQGDNNIPADNNFLRNTSDPNSDDVGGNWGNTFGSINYFHSSGFAPSIVTSTGTIVPQPTQNGNSCTQLSKFKKSGSSAEESLRLWPNPVSGLLYIHNPKAVQQPGVISDLSGRVIRELSLKEGLNVLDMAEVTSGVYLLQVGNETFKIQVQH